MYPQVGMYLMHARVCAGDVEADFFLAFDLLRNPKDHFEFTQVRNWIKRALMVSPFCSASVMCNPFVSISYALLSNAQVISVQQSM